MAYMGMDRPSYKATPYLALNRTVASWLSGRTPWNLWRGISSFRRPSIPQSVLGDESMHEKRHEASRQVVGYSTPSACFYTELAWI